MFGFDFLLLLQQVWESTLFESHFVTLFEVFKKIIVKKL
jgi:hypothetical protein